jgi:hypothetical protein
MQPPQPKNLVTTDHALLRAKERLGLDSGAFHAWVAATSSGWELHDAAYFEAQNLQVGRSAWLYRCPFTVTDSVCIAVSQDHAIKTVMRYEDIDNNRLRERLEKSERSMKALRGQYDQERKSISAIKALVLSMGLHSGSVVPWTHRAVLRLLGNKQTDIAYNLIARMHQIGAPKVCWAFCTERLRTADFSDAISSMKTIEATDSHLSGLGIRLSEYTEVLK